MLLIGAAVRAEFLDDFLFAVPPVSHHVRRHDVKRPVPLVILVALIKGTQDELLRHAFFVEEFTGFDHRCEAEGGSGYTVLVMIRHAQFFADPFREEVGHRVVFCHHFLGNRFFKNPPFFCQFPVNRFGGGIDEAMNVGVELADTLKQVERAHAVDGEIVAIIKRPPECSGDMINGINAFHRSFDILVFAQISEHRLHAFVSIKAIDTMDIAGIDEAADVMSFFQ